MTDWPPVNPRIDAAKDALDQVDTVLGNQTKIVKLAERTCTISNEFKRAVHEALDSIDDALSVR